MGKIILYFNLENHLFEFHLPAINNRRFSINLNQYVEYDENLNFEVWDNIWYILNSPNISLIQDGQETEYACLDYGSVVHIQLKQQDVVIAMLVQAQNSATTNFRKYYINDLDRVVVGCEQKCDICIHDDFVSHEHLVLEKRAGKFYAEDKSRNGTFLNGNRIFQATELELFDEIYVFGIKMIFLDGILAINHCDELGVSLPEIDVRNLEIPTTETGEEEVFDGNFHRSPRNMEPLLTDTIDIEGAPTKQEHKEQPIIFVLGPSVTMPIPIMLSVLFNMYVNSGMSNSRMFLGTLISVLSSALIGAGWAIAHRVYNRKEEQKTEAARVANYREYIEKNRKLLEERVQHNKEVLEEQYQDTKSLIQIATQNQSLLWNRNINHEDFLTIRIGKGKVPYKGAINIPKERFSMQADELQLLPQELYMDYRNMADAVHTIDLRENHLVGVVSKKNKAYEFLRVMAIQIAALHSYSDVKLAFICDSGDAEAVAWARWMPHVFSVDKKNRYMAYDENSQRNVLYDLLSELRSREEKLEGKRGDMRLLPHYVVFCTTHGILEEDPIFSYVVSKENYGFTFVLLYDRLDKLPNECVHIIEDDNRFSGCYDLTETKNETNEVEFDRVSLQDADYFARSISGIFVNETAGGEIPTSIDFLEMLGVGKLEQWDLLQKYKENRVYEKIQGMIGVTHGNRPIYLDIHEKKFGPHGLVAGTTGSGKSETIMTFILSLAMNYHPDEVAFVLIDYKGGGMAAPFVNLPHTAGTITNIGNEENRNSIDENQTRRALVSIKSEIQRRQRIFSKYKVNHIDSYIRMYRDGQADEALPHLIIISDEFAELKKEHPEFIKELVSTARVGRSLGMHLILATQKPYGIVDEEIWSNSRFKICLRVQDKQDSVGMLKRPEAAYITGIGRAYLQIGNDEIFELFQSGYAGAPYEPKEKMEPPQDRVASMIGIDGQECVKITRKINKNTISQLEACVQYIERVAEENQIAKVRPLWLPALTSEMYLEDVSHLNPQIDKNGIIATYGLIDRADIQKQYLATINLIQTANILIVGNIGMGKSTMLQTMLYSLVTNYSSEQVNLYIMDFSSRTFRIFDKVPHCGGVAFSEDEEMTERMMKLLLTKIDERKALFEEAEVGSYQEYLSIHNLPMVVLCIDNYAMFKELYEKLEESLGTVLREGFKYGIQVIVTETGANDVSYRMRQFFSKTIALGLAEKGKYSDALGVTPDFLPALVRGRGLVREAVVAEYQTLLAVKGTTELERNQKMRAVFESIVMAQGESHAVRTKKLPRNESYADFYVKHQCANKLPLGYNVNSLQTVMLEEEASYCYVISYCSEKSAELVLNNFTYAYDRKGYKVIHINHGEEKEYLDAGSYEDIYNLTLELLEEFTKRSAMRKERPSVTSEDIVREFGGIAILIGDLKKFVDRIYEWETDKEQLFPSYEQFFEKGSGLGIHFIAALEVTNYHSVAGTRAGRFFIGYGEGIHMGGRLDKQNLFECNLSLSQQMNVLDYNVGHCMKQNTLVEIFVPLDEGENL